MNRNSILAFAAALPMLVPLTAHAYTTGACAAGTYDNPPTINSPVSKYFAYSNQTQTVGSVNFWGLDGAVYNGGNGVAWMNLQRNCGEIALYAYTGTSPSTGIMMEAHLDPQIVPTTIAQLKCIAGPSTTQSAYYFGYPAQNPPEDKTYFPDADGAYLSTDSHWYGGASHWVIPVWAYGSSGGNYAANSTYTLILICPPIKPTN